MWQSLQNIQNPFTRSLTAAIVTAAVMTLGSAVGIGFSRIPPKDKPHRTAIYATLLMSVAGAIAGWATPAKSPEKPASTNTDWRDFQVVRKVQESDEITSFYLEPVDGGGLVPYQPGQFLTLKLQIPGQSRPVIRTYSLSDYPESLTYYRLSIKRELAPQGLDVPPGIASNFMHDQIQVGSIIPTKPPSGKFTLDLGKQTPAVLISNGVGITPMLSMVKASTGHSRDRAIWFIHGARSGNLHACRAEVVQLQGQNPHLQVHFCYSRPNPEDEGHYHSTGYVDVDLLKSLIPDEAAMQADYFLCGSPPFMDSLRTGLQAWGVPDHQVYFEAFSKPKTPPSTAPQTDHQASCEITFTQSGRTLTWQPSDGTILEFAEKNGLQPDFSCRSGICLTCMCAVKSGEVQYAEAPAGQPESGHALICVGTPKSTTLVLEV